ncbi:MAG: coproporphyrinogen III oxidase [Alphaproteobacteria bacterium]|nr:coproporphyrinogen III oxidase [Alphaproteobacteria bacterium]
MPPAAASDEAFGLYVHWPFCLSKCPYCDFNSHVRERIDSDAWASALVREIDHFAALTPGRRVTSIYFGGGTPSLMDCSATATIIDRAAARWGLADAVEVTLEANPTSVEAGKMKDFSAAGINRLSLGIQSLEDESLRLLGRRHSAREARAAIALAARTFDRFSFDLIYARPGQTIAAWEAELREGIALAGEHLSVYQLTIEPGTAFHQVFGRGDLVLPPENEGAELYHLTQAVLGDAGLPAYEISNHARPGAECRHNLVYWRYQDYVGVGPGAHGRIAIDGVRHATRQEKVPETWVSRAMREGHATVESLPVGRDDAVTEALMMGLRLAEGVDGARFARQTGVALMDAIDPAAAARLVAGGFLERMPAGVRATPAGRAVLNAVIGALLD